jgi:hypothetical protein
LGQSHLLRLLGLSLQLGLSDRLCHLTRLPKRLVHYLQSLSSQFHLNLKVKLVFHRTQLAQLMRPKLSTFDN